MSGKIRLITKRNRILGVSTRWRTQYWHKQWEETDKHAIYLKLKALDLSVATEDEVCAIIGNRSWTDIKCDQCEKYVERAVLIGGSDEYGPDEICEQCLREAVHALEDISELENGDEVDNEQ